MLTGAVTVESSTHNGLINVNIAIPDFKVITAIRIGTNPSLVVNGRSLTAEVREGYQVTIVAFLALRIGNLFHGVHLPTKFKSPVVYTNR